MKKIIFVTGALDPEMITIRRLINQQKETLPYVELISATVDNKFGAQENVRPFNAYRAEKPSINELLREEPEEVIFVECSLGGREDILREHGIKVTRIDHHNPGDPGFGKGPEEFWEASSIGQTYAYFGLSKEDAHPDDILVAAGDHCLTHAYQGRCPGVDKDKLLYLRLSNKSQYEKRSVEEIYKDFKNSIEVFKSLPRMSFTLNGELQTVVVDDGNGLPYGNEVQAYLNMPYYYTHVMNDGTIKKGLFGNKELVEYFMEKVLKEAGCTRIYGDPERGFCGGYIEALSEA